MSRFERGDRGEYLMRLDGRFERYRRAVIKFDTKDPATEAELMEARYLFSLCLGLEDRALGRGTPRREVVDITAELGSLSLPNGDRDSDLTASFKRVLPIQPDVTLGRAEYEGR